jgi:hypothetical protein
MPLNITPYINASCKEVKGSKRIFNHLFPSEIYKKKNQKKSLLTCTNVPTLFFWGHNRNDTHFFIWPKARVKLS